MQISASDPSRSPDRPSSDPQSGHSLIGIDSASLPAVAVSTWRAVYRNREALPSAGAIRVRYRVATPIDIGLRSRRAKSQGAEIDIGG